MSPQEAPNVRHSGRGALEAARARIAELEARVRALETERTGPPEKPPVTADAAGTADRELQAMRGLHELVTRLLVTPDLRDALEEVLEATMALTGADMGNVQLLDPEREVLQIRAQRGFDADFLERFEEVDADDPSACGRAIASRERVIVEDVRTDRDYASLVPHAEAAGYRAVQSTPLLGHSGELLGVLSTHYRDPHRPSERELRILDLYTRQAADLLELHRSRHALETSLVRLRRSETKYRSLFDSIDEGFCILEVLFDEDENPVDFRYLEINPVFADQTGLEDAEGRTIGELVPGIESVWLETYGSVALTGEARRFVEHVESLGRWFDVYAFRIGDPEERRVAVLFDDITGVKRAERERERLFRELQVERSRLEYVFEQAPAFLAVLRGPDHVFELANEAYLRLVGRREILHKPIRAALPEVVEQGFVGLLDRVLMEGEPFVGREVPVNLARTPGAPLEERFVDFSYLPIQEADGSRSGVIAHGTDVTQHVLARREIERLLRESEGARSEAEAANRAKSEFLAAMSHELRTPLNAIAGYVDLLDLGIHGPLNDAQHHTLSRVRANQRHLLALINDVLDFARGEAGRLQLKLRPLSVGAQLREIEPLVAPLADARGVELVVAPDGKDGTRVVGDEERLRQTLLNLLDNAVKFTEPGGWVRLSAEASDQWVDIRVADCGPGIPLDHQATIFDPFVQVGRRLDRPLEGVGLGLAISRDLARAMGGDLTVESVPGEGATFTLRLARYRGATA